MFERVSDGILNIEPVVKPNDERSGNPLHYAIQGAAAFVSQQVTGEFDQEVGGGAEMLSSLIMGIHIRKIQVADEAGRRQ